MTQTSLRLHQRRDRLERHVHENILAVGHPALEPTRAVARACEPAAGHFDGIVDRAPPLARRGERVGELHALRALDRHEGLRDAAVETPVPLRRRAEPRDGAADPQRDDPAERVTRVARLRDRVDHLRGPHGIGAAHLARFDGVRVEARHALDAPDRARLAPDLHAHDA
jgi:hypothetical protein